MRSILLTPNRKLTHALCSAHANRSRPHVIVHVPPSPYVCRSHGCLGGRWRATTFVLASLPCSVFTSDIKRMRTTRTRSHGWDNFGGWVCVLSKAWSIGHAATTTKADTQPRTAYKLHSPCAHNIGERGSTKQNEFVGAVELLAPPSCPSLFCHTFVCRMHSNASSASPLPIRDVCVCVCFVDSFLYSCDVI